MCRTVTVTVGSHSWQSQLAVTVGSANHVFIEVYTAVYAYYCCQVSVSLCFSGGVAQCISLSQEIGINDFAWSLCQVSVLP